MTDVPDLTKVTPAENLRGEDERETQMLRAMRADAERYIREFPWCARVLREFFGIGIGGVVAVFLFEIEPIQKGVDRWIWTIVGDLPPAYIATDEARNPAAALDAYIGAMDAWVRAAMTGASVDDLIPVNVPPSPVHAARLKTRLEFLDREILNNYRDDLRR